MKRSDIYNKYLENINKSCRVEGLVYRNGLEWVEHVTRDTGIHFYTVGKLDMEYALNKMYCDSKIGAYVLKLSIPKEFNGYPVVSMVNFALSLALIKDNLVVDFSDSDLSNILDASKLFGERKCHIVDVVFPDENSRRLKPVKIDSMFSTDSLVDINKILDKVDLSEVSIASYAFNNTGVEHFDFDRCNFKNLECAESMFFNCRNLIKVTGSFGSNKILDVNSMFEDCWNLEEVDAGLYRGTTLRHIDNMFSSCSKIKYTYLDKADIHFTGRESIGYPFACCNNLDLYEINRVIEHIFNAGTRIHGIIFDGLEKDLFTGDYKVFCCYTYASGMIFFHNIKSKMVDLSDSDTNDVKFGVIDLFVHPRHLNKNLHSIYETGFSHQIMEGIPKVLIVNHEHGIRDLDKEVFNIVDFREYESDIIEIKLQYMKMDMTTDRFLVIVNKGWRDK